MFKWSEIKKGDILYESNKYGGYSIQIEATSDAYEYMDGYGFHARSHDNDDLNIYYGNSAYMPAVNKDHPEYYGEVIDLNGVRHSAKEWFSDLL